VWLFYYYLQYRSGIGILMSRSGGLVRGKFALRPRIGAERVPHLLDRFAGICNDSCSFCPDLLLPVMPDVSQGGRFYWIFFQELLVLAGA
jgi:coenzyme F420-reducing hydrogenase beta subunit